MIYSDNYNDLIIRESFATRSSNVVNNKYAVIYSNGNKEMLIDLISSIDDYVNKIKDKHTDANFINNCTIDDIRDKDYNEGIYLVLDEDTVENVKLTLIKKVKRLQIGIFYNSEIWDINILKSWKIIENYMNISVEDIKLECFDLNVIRNNMMDEYLSFLLVGNKECGKTSTIFKLIDNVPEKYAKNIYVVVKDITDEKYNKYKETYPNANFIQNEQIMLAECMNSKFGIIIFDESLTQDTNWTKNQRLLEIFYNYRYFNKILIVGIPTECKLPPALSNEFKYVFLFGQSDQVIQRQLYNTYCKEIKNIDLEKFKKIMLETSKYDVLVVDRSSDVVLKCKKHNDWTYKKTDDQLMMEKIRGNEYTECDVGMMDMRCFAPSNSDTPFA